MPSTRTARRVIPPLFALAIALAAPTVAPAEIQATKHGIHRWLHGVCEDIISDRGREIIAERNMTVAAVCGCFVEDMWGRYPTLYFWVQETTPYEWNQVTAKFPEALATCVFD